MDILFKTAEHGLLLKPKFGPRDMVPWTLFILAFIITTTILILFVIGVFLSIPDPKEWLGAAFGILFSGVSVWLARLTARTVMQAGPRRFQYDLENQCFEIVRLGWKSRWPRASIKSISPRMEVSRGGFKKAPGIWLYLVLEHVSGKRTDFFLTRVPSLENATRDEIRNLFNDLGRLTGLAVGKTKIKEI